MKRKPSYSNNILMAILISLVVSAVIILVQLSFAKKCYEEEFKVSHMTRIKGILERGYEYYIAEDHNETQFKYYLGGMVEGVNGSYITSPFSDEIIVSDTFAFYDANMNSLIPEGTLILNEKDAYPDSKKKHIYGFYDKEFTMKLQGMIEEYGEDIGEFVFNLKGAYIIDDNTFFPETVTCYRVGEGGAIKDKTVLYSADMTDGDMYDFLNVDESFFLREALISYEVSYISEKSNSNMQRVNELVKEAVDKSGGKPVDSYSRKDLSPFTMELFSVQKISEGDYYGACYRKINTLFEAYSYSLLGGRGALYIEVYAFEAFIVMIIFVIASVIITKLRLKKYKASDKTI